MKTKNDQIHDAVLEFIKANPASSIEAITVGTKNSDILVRASIKALQAEGVIAADGDTGAYSFIGKGKKAIEAAAASKKETVQKPEAKASKKDEDEDLGPKLGGRDSTKYSFNGVDQLSKSRLVLTVLQKYVEDSKKTSLSKIQEVLQSTELQKRFGVIRLESEAREYTKGKIDRFFLKPQEILIVGQKKDKCAVCNQWSADTLKPFLKIVKELGYKVTVSK